MASSSFFDLHSPIDFTRSKYSRDLNLAICVAAIVSDVSLLLLSSFSYDMFSCFLFLLSLNGTAQKIKKKGERILKKLQARAARSFE